MENETTIFKASAKSPGWKPSCLWLALAVGCFHAAYTSLKFPAAGLMVFGYAFALVRLTNQPTVRRAFYFGLTAGFLCYAPQLWFFFNIFNAAAVVLWLVLAFGSACSRRSSAVASAAGAKPGLPGSFPLCGRALNISAANSTT